ncbi:uncharacterized protein TEOVI_000416500 [Trypanosoma equiperdum]|nr:hypothetical protein DPX39_100078500 [Trypanosoma brucei equiperdum]SCU72588.1 hypothetical protein, conserved [Trypanosoma equiperdum]
MSRATYSRSTSPYRSPRGGTPSRSTDASAFIRFLLSENIDQRIADTKRWLRRIREHMRNNAPRRCSRCFDPSMIFCAIRASSALLTEKPNRHRMSARPRRFRCSLNSFLDGTPFLTPRDLCRYNTSVAKRLSDDELELMRKYVFDYDEVAFADLLYGDDIIPDDSEEGRDESPRSRRRILAAVRAFNERSRIAMERLFAAPGGLVDAVMRITLLVPLVSNDMDDSDEG